MNEITKIHLGRQAFTIAVDAHKELQEYLRAIKRHMGDADEAVEEVEIRMAELLTERGISGDKVVLLKDVDYLKEQLGKPGDFGDEDDKAGPEDSEGSKRLFRDTQNAMIAGVSAGIGKYFGIDPLWIRLAFIALTFAGASGILIYIILWLIVPEAKTSSERLQMQGTPVTVDALKDVVERADVEGAAKRASNVVGKAVQSVLKVILAIIGVALMIAGIAILIALVASSVYFFLNYKEVIPFDIFPVGRAEHTFVGLTVGAIALLALLLTTAGLAAIRRRSSFPGWVLVIIFTFFFSTAAASTALGASTAPKIVDRYEAAHHSDVRTVAPFTEINLIGDDSASRQADVERRNSSDYKIEFRYMGKADTGGITIKEVKPGVLDVDTTSFKPDPACDDNPCIFANSEFRVIIHAPDAKHITIHGDGEFSSELPDFEIIMPARPGEPAELPYR